MAFDGGEFHRHVYSNVSLYVDEYVYVCIYICVYVYMCICVHMVGSHTKIITIQSTVDN